jgi:hypothetical protein
MADNPARRAIEEQVARADACIARGDLMGAAAIRDALTIRGAWDCGDQWAQWGAEVIAISIDAHDAARKGKTQ